MKVYPGETIGVVGESGCGKSTLGRTILRLIEPTSGQILYNGEDITKLNARQMKRMRQELQIISKIRMQALIRASLSSKSLPNT